MTESDTDTCNHHSQTCDLHILLFGCRYVLTDIFNMVDTDGNGLLSRDEFNRYSMRSGEDEVGDDEWEIVKGIPHPPICLSLSLSLSCFLSPLASHINLSCSLFPPPTYFSLSLFFSHSPHYIGSLPFYLSFFWKSPFPLHAFGKLSFTDVFGKTE